MTDLTHPGAVMARLVELEADLAHRQNAYEAAASAWYRMKRDREHARAVAFIKAEGTVAERNALADVETSLMGRDEEALFESMRAVMRTIEARLSVGQSILRAQSK